MFPSRRETPLQNNDYMKSESQRFFLGVELSSSKSKIVFVKSQLQLHYLGYSENLVRTAEDPGP